VSFCNRARRSFYLGPDYLYLQAEAVFNDRRELQRNVKGFITLSKYLLRGRQHEKTDSPRQESADAGMTPVTSAQGGD
jgi:anaerobic magnesium-protoporphyrin IX monomethyl ester cyclase